MFIEKKHANWICIIMILGNILLFIILATVNAAKTGKIAEFEDANISLAQTAMTSTVSYPTSLSAWFPEMPYQVL